MAASEAWQALKLLLQTGRLKEFIPVPATGSKKADLPF